MSIWEGLAIGAAVDEHGVPGSGGVERRLDQLALVDVRSLGVGGRGGEQAVTAVAQRTRVRRDMIRSRSDSASAEILRARHRDI